MSAQLRLAGESLKPLPQKFNFTIPSLKSAACPKGKNRVFLYDEKQGGLALQITSNGAKTFYCVGRLNGRKTRYLLGSFDDVLDLDELRRRTKKIIGQWSDGIDPAAQRKQARAAMTLQELFEHYMTTHANLHKRHPEQDRQMFDRYMGGWKTRAINTIIRADLAALHAKIGEDHGQYAANRLLALLSKLFNVAADFGIERNPTKGIQKFRESSRMRFVGVDEMPRLLAAIEKESAPFDDFFRLAIFTGARRGNLQSARWEEISLSEKVWVIPGNKAKAHEDIRIPLVDEAVIILEARLKAREDDNEWVFPSWGKTGHISEVKKAWKQILTRAKLKDLRVHDLRRTAGSWMAARGASLQTIGKLMGHRNASTTQVYSRLDLDAVREALAGAAGAMTAASKVKAGGK